MNIVFNYNSLSFIILCIFGLMWLIQQSDLTQLQVIATNMHLSPRYGNT